MPCITSCNDNVSYLLSLTNLSTFLIKTFLFSLLPQNSVGTIFKITALAKAETSPIEDAKSVKLSFCFKGGDSDEGVVPVEIEDGKGGWETSLLVSLLPITLLTWGMESRVSGTPLSHNFEADMISTPPERRGDRREKQ